MNHALVYIFQAVRFLADALEKRFEYIGLLIDGFLVEYPGGPTTFNFEELKAIYDTKRLEELISRAGQNAWTNEKQKRAVDMFLHRLKQESKGSLIDADSQFFTKSE